MLKTKYCERKEQQSNDSIKLNLVWDDIHVNNMKKIHFKTLPTFNLKTTETET
jgi:hypothetical protein